MKILLALLTCSAAFAQTTLYLRYGGPGSNQQITDCTNTSPIVCTTSSTHGFSVGDRVWIFGVRGNTAANGYRIVANLPSQSSFTLQDLSAMDVVGNGPYEGNGFAGRVRATTLVPHPRGLLDGAGGTLTTRAQDPDGAGPLKAPQAVDGFAPWDAISTYNSSTLTSPLSLSSLQAVDTTERMLPVALKWYADQSDTNRRNAVLAWLNNLEKVVDARSTTVPYFAQCDETKPGCGFSDPEMDWMWSFWVGALDSYTIMRSELSIEERKSFVDKMLNGIFGQACTNRLTWGGSSRVSVSGANVTCTSGQCGFTSIPSPSNRSLYLRPTAASTGQWFNIASVSDDSHLVLTQVVTGASANEANIPWGYAADWGAGMCGYLWQGTHHGYTPSFLTLESYTKLNGAITNSQTTITVANAANIPAIGRDYYIKIGSEFMKVTSRSGNDLTVERGSLFTSPASAANNASVWGTSVPPSGGSETSTPLAIANPWELDLEVPQHNLYWSKNYGAIRAGCALADDDERARRLCEDAWNYFYDFVYPDAKDRWSGLTQGGYSYGQGRWAGWTSEVALIGKYQFYPPIDITDGNWLKAQGDYMPQFSLPWSPSSSIMWGDSGVDPTMFVRYFRYLMVQYFLFGASKETSEGMFWFRNVYDKWKPANLSGPSDYQILPHAYLYIPTNVTCPSEACKDYRTTENLTRFFTANDFDPTQWATNYNFVTSRSDWSNLPLSWVQMFALGDPNDHSGSQAPGTYKIAVNGQYVHANGPSTLDSSYGANRPEGQIVVSNVSGTTNVGNGTVTGPEDAIGDRAVTGNWIVTCTVAATDGGSFSVAAPNGEIVGTAIVGEEFSAPAYYGPLRFTISDGTIDWAVGDKKTISVLGTDQRFSRNSFPDINKTGTTVYSHGLAMPSQNKNSRGYFGNFVTVDKQNAGDGYAYWRLNLDNSYQSSAEVARARRHFAHLTGTEAYTVVYDELATATTKPKERSVFCYSDDGVLSYSRVGNTLNCTRSAARLQSLVLLPADPSKITQSGGQVNNSITYAYTAGSSTQRPDGALQAWTLPENVAWPISVRIDDDGPGSGTGYTYRTWGIAGVDTGRQWYWTPGTAVVSQCDNMTVNTCPGSQEAPPSESSYVTFGIYTDISVGWTVAPPPSTEEEMLVVHCAFAGTTGDCPGTSTLTTISSNSRGVLINHSLRPRVVIFDKNSTQANTSTSFTLSGLLAGVDILISGLAAGTYEVSKNSVSIYSGVVVANDGVLRIPATDGHSDGDYLILQTGASAPLDITTASPLAPATVGIPYSTDLAATGGTAPYFWERTGGDVWPSGLSLASSGTISGTPTAAQTKVVQVRVCDSSLNQLCTSPVAFTLQVSPGSSSQLTFSGPGSLPSGTVGTTYPPQTLLASGGTSPYTFSLQSGALPTGLGLSGTGNSVFSGVPSAVGTYNFTLRVTDASSPVKTSDRSYSVTVTSPIPPPVVTTASLPNGLVGESYDAELAATNGQVPYTWSVASGALCEGLTLSSDGRLSGQPTQVEECQFTIQVEDANQQSGSELFIINIARPVTVSLTAVARPASRGVMVVYGRPGLDATRPCAVNLWQGPVLVGSATQEGGPARRYESFASLTPGSEYTLKADCGVDVSDMVTFTTQPAVSGTRTEVLQLSAPSWANGVTVNWGIAAVTENSLSQSCTSSCSISLTNLQRGVIYRVRHTWNRPGGDSPVQSSTFYLPVD